MRSKESLRKCPFALSDATSSRRAADKSPDRDAIRKAKGHKWQHSRAAMEDDHDVYEDIQESLLRGEQTIRRNAKWFYEDFTGTFVA